MTRVDLDKICWRYVNFNHCFYSHVTFFITRLLGKYCSILSRISGSASHLLWAHQVPGRKTQCPLARMVKQRLGLSTCASSSDVTLTEPVGVLQDPRKPPSMSNICEEKPCLLMSGLHSCVQFNDDSIFLCACFQDECSALGDRTCSVTFTVCLRVLPLRVWLHLPFLPNALQFVLGSHFHSEQGIMEIQIS